MLFIRDCANHYIPKLSSVQRGVQSSALSSDRIEDCGFPFWSFHVIGDSPWPIFPPFPSIALKTIRMFGVPCLIKRKDSPDTSAHFYNSNEIDNQYNTSIPIHTRVHAFLSPYYTDTMWREPLISEQGRVICVISCHWISCRKQPKQTREIDIAEAVGEACTLKLFLQLNFSLSCLTSLKSGRLTLIFQPDPIFAEISIHLSISLPSYKTVAICIILKKSKKIHMDSLTGEPDMIWYTCTYM